MRRARAVAGAERSEPKRPLGLDVEAVARYRYHVTQEVQMSRRSTEFRPTPFGELIDRKRHEQEKSIRALAREVGVSHVGLGDVIRGKRLTLGQEYWAQLVKALPGLTVEDLQTAAERSQAREIRPWEFEGRKREVAARMAEAADDLESGVFADDDLEEVLKVLLRIRERK